MADVNQCRGMKPLSLNFKSNADFQPKLYITNSTLRHFADRLLFVPIAAVLVPTAGQAIAEILASTSGSNGFGTHNDVSSSTSLWLRRPAFHSESVTPLLEILNCYPLDHLFGLRLVKPPGGVVRWIVESVCDFSSKRRNLARGAH